MKPLLGMYVHTHWSYNQPYAARTWTLDQWKGYLTGLQRLGYNLVQIWPMLDTMPVPPTPSDIEHLEKLRQVIRFAHERGMVVYVGISPNTSANDKAASFTFQDRTYFESEALIDPSDETAMDREMERRRVVLEPLAEADGLWVLDCDPGGFEGSPVSEFVEILARHRELLDRIRGGIRLVYWMWAGWTDKHRFDPEWAENPQACWIEAVDGMNRLQLEPWAVHACWPGHFKSLQAIGCSDRAHFYPYNLIEFEPSYPFTNWEPERIASAFEKFSEFSYPMGVLGNSQTHCVQLPHAYVFSHFAMGGTMDNLDPAGFGERLFPGHGRDLAAAWRALSMRVGEASVPREAGRVISSMASGNIQTGDLEGLLFGGPRRYLRDLALQLDLWADILDLEKVASDPARVKPALREVVDSLHAWNDCHGFRDRYIDLYYYRRVHPIYQAALNTIGTPAAMAGIEKLEMVSVRSHGRNAMLMDALDAVVAE